MKTPSLCVQPRASMGEFATLLMFCLAVVIGGCGGGGGTSSSGGSTPTPPTSINGDPLAAVIETSDLRRFIDVYRSEAPNFVDLENSIQRRYFDPGTPGLKSFITLRITNANLMAQTVRGSPAFYAAIIPQLEDISTNPLIATRTRTAFQSLKNLVPDAVFPPTTFVVGRLTTGGTVSDQGILMGSEFVSASPSALAAAAERVYRQQSAPASGCGAHRRA